MSKVDVLISLAHSFEKKLNLLKKQAYDAKNGTVTPNIKPKLIGFATALDAIINAKGQVASQYFYDSTMPQYAQPWPLPGQMGLGDFITQDLKNMSHDLKLWSTKTEVPYQEWLALYTTWRDYRFPLKKESREWIDSMISSLSDELGFYK